VTRCDRGGVWYGWWRRSLPPSRSRVGRADVVELRQPTRDCGSHSSNHGVEGGDSCGGGSVNESPTCCTGKPYWGAAEMACDVDQYGAPPVGGSKEEGCTEKPYWSAVKRECSVYQYGAPPMNGSKGGQAGVPAAVLARVPATAATAQGNTCGDGCMRLPR
jgi:hypothetical protein